MSTDRPRPAHEVRAALARPLFNPVLKTWVGAGELDHERYVRTQDLLALQTPVDQLVDPDELMFQVVHGAGATRRGPAGSPRPPATWTSCRPSSARRPAPS